MVAPHSRPRGCRQQGIHYCCPEAAQIGYPSPALVHDRKQRIQHRLLLSRRLKAVKPPNPLLQLVSHE